MTTTKGFKKGLLLTGLALGLVTAGTYHTHTVNDLQERLDKVSYDSETKSRFILDLQDIVNIQEATVKAQSATIKSQQTFISNEDVTVTYEKDSNGSSYKLYVSTKEDSENIYTSNFKEVTDTKANLIQISSSKGGN